MYNSHSENLLHSQVPFILGNSEWRMGEEGNAVFHKEKSLWLLHSPVAVHAESATCVFAQYVWGRI